MVSLPLVLPARKQRSKAEEAEGIRRTQNNYTIIVRCKRHCIGRLVNSAHGCQGLGESGWGDAELSSLSSNEEDCDCPNKC